jgi:mono/diheme cytochrome c family protein
MPMLLLAFLFPLFTGWGVVAQTASHWQPLIRPVDGPGIFQNYCAACHGVDARGRGPASGALKQRVPDLTRLSQANDGVFPFQHVKTTILLGSDDLIPAHGSKRMPIWGPIFHEIEFDRDLGCVRLENVTSYLESIQKK